MNHTNHRPELIYCSWYDGMGWIASAYLEVSTVGLKMPEGLNKCLLLTCQGAYGCNYSFTHPKVTQLILAEERNRMITDREVLDRFATRVATITGQEVAA